MGIYHPHAEKHNIKKENIGLIEVMGLAVLPARLQTEMAHLAELLVGGACDSDIAADEICAKHADWVASFRGKYSFTEENVDRIICDEIGATFISCLEDCGVFKLTDEGQAAFIRFVEHMGGKA